MNIFYKQKWKINPKNYKLKKGRKYTRKKRNGQIYSRFPLVPLDLSTMEFSFMVVGNRSFSMICLYNGEHEVSNLALVYQFRTQ